MRAALEDIARLLLEEADYDYDPCSKGPDIACAALGWVYFRCKSKFTGCNVDAVGPTKDLLAVGWEIRDGCERCPEHAGKTDPTSWAGVPGRG